MAKEIPYGIKDFVNVVEDNRYYVDKTMFIPELEKAGNFLFFIRPRRFGKSLLLSMLAAYYDISTADRFQELFGDLYIGQHPTKNQGKYQVLTLDFSQAANAGDDIATNVRKYMKGALVDFIDKYAEYYPEKLIQFVEGDCNYAEALDLICRMAQRKGYHLYLILDEYDNFTNNVLNEQGHDAYHSLTHASGFYREMFKMFKADFERIFMTGVSPVTPDDLTSGYNIGINISNEAGFNYLLGFSTEDVRDMFNYYQRQGLLKGDVEAMIDEIKPWYDNYCFAEEHINDSRIFNSDMVLYYLRARVNNGKSPDSLIDKNASTDYKKLKRLLDWDQFDGPRKGVIQEIVQKGETITTLVDMFPAENIMDQEIFPSLLYYYGMLTMKRKMGNMMVLNIPNNNVRVLYYDSLLKMYQAHTSISVKEMNLAYYAMAVQGDWRPALDYIANRYAATSSIRDNIEGERNIQGFMLAMLSLCSYYLVAPELELNHGYCDFFFLPDHIHYPEVAHSYILELKYLPAKCFDERSDTQWNEAVNQIHKYAQAERVRTLQDGTEIHCIVAQFKGWKMVRCEEV